MALTLSKAKHSAHAFTIIIRNHITNNSKNGNNDENNNVDDTNNADDDQHK